MAALDLGTNNCRLLIAEVGPGGFRPLRGVQRLVRLGEGLARGGRLAPAAVARTLAVLADYDRLARAEGATERRGVVTEVARRAADGRDFLDRARAPGWPLEIASAEREARLALLACRPLVDPAAPRTVIADIGGGSSEILLHRPGAAWVGVSLPLGAVVLRERLGDGADPAVFAAVAATVRAALARSGLPALAPEPGATLIGTSGTATVLAGLALGLAEPDRARIDGAVLAPAALVRARETFVAWSPERRCAHPLVGPRRADVLATGAAILETVMDWFGCTRFVAADRGPLEGLVREACGETAPSLHLTVVAEAVA